MAHPHNENLYRRKTSDTNARNAALAALAAGLASFLGIFRLRLWLVLRKGSLMSYQCLYLLLLGSVSASGTNLPKSPPKKKSGPPEIYHFPPCYLQWGPPCYLGWGQFNKHIVFILGYNAFFFNELWSYDIATEPRSPDTQKQITPLKIRIMFQFQLHFCIPTFALRSACILYANHI